MKPLHFHVQGRPVPQGSMVPIIQWDRRRWFMPTPPKLKHWRNMVKLMALHDACCAAHEARIAELLSDPVYLERRNAILAL